MNLKKVRKILEALVLATVILPFLLSTIFPSLAPLWIALAVGLCAATIFFIGKFWRCPYCGKGLGNSALGHNAPKFCPNCGHKLDDLE